MYLKKYLKFKFVLGRVRAVFSSYKITSAGPFLVLPEILINIVGNALSLSGCYCPANVLMSCVISFEDQAKLTCENHFLFNVLLLPYRKVLNENLNKR